MSYFILSTLIEIKRNIMTFPGFVEFLGVNLGIDK